MTRIRLSLDPPERVQIHREDRPRSEPWWRSFPWHPSLQWAADLPALSEEQACFLRRVHEGLVQGSFQ
jgi:hypothetical protein